LGKGYLWPLGGECREEAQLLSGRGVGPAAERIDVPATVVVGSQWGDEGKGRVVDLLAADADLVVRFQGGNNAGHTVWVGDQRYAFHLIPTGILRGKLSVLGAGMVIDLSVLLQEATELAARGVPVQGNLRISENAHLILPYHKVMEKAEEERRGSRAIGTTRRGIGPAYEDKVARRGIRVGDLRDPDGLARKLDDILAYKNAIIESCYALPAVDRDEIYQDLRAKYDHFREWICDTSTLVLDHLSGGKNVLFEGAHGTMLDIDWGTYPYVTSSNPLSGAVCAGAGVGPKCIGRIIGVAKAYTTRVGAGPFPTKQDEVAKVIRDLGGEYGTTTGRARDVGWLDCVVLRKAARLNGLDSLAITHLDVLGQFDEIPVCVSYNCDGASLTEFPNDIDKLNRCRPVYENLLGWRSDISGARGFSDLPEQAKRYLNRISELVGVPISHVLVGRQRGQDILL
jgi:adenylosuccinate synthase